MEREQWARNERGFGVGKSMDDKRWMSSCLGFREVDWGARKAGTFKGIGVFSLPFLRFRLLTTLAGNKKDNITVIYTPWSNLKKDGSMAVGQVGFKNQKMVRSSRYLYA